MAELSQLREVRAADPGNGKGKGLKKKNNKKGGKNMRKSDKKSVGKKNNKSGAKSLGYSYLACIYVVSVTAQEICAK